MESRLPARKCLISGDPPAGLTSPAGHRDNPDRPAIRNRAARSLPVGPRGVSLAGPLHLASQTPGRLKPRPRHQRCRVVDRSWLMEVPKKGLPSRLAGSDWCPRVSECSMIGVQPVCPDAMNCFDSTYRGRGIYPVLLSCRDESASEGGCRRPSDRFATPSISRFLTAASCRDGIGPGREQPLGSALDLCHCLLSGAHHSCRGGDRRLRFRCRDRFGIVLRPVLQRQESAEVRGCHPTLVATDLSR